MATLLDIWLGQKDFFETKTIEQVISIAGNGHLLDNNETSVQLRELLSNIPSDRIQRYINECLDQPFAQSGLVLQDLVNEVGRRLGFSVDPGYYRGGRSKIGFDGLWRAKDGYAFVIEVKTTDAYQLNLDTQAEYRRRLIDEGRISEKASSILIIVGRKDTGGLEAQTRGSRHAWDIRLISVEALLKLMRVKENLSDSGTVSQIQEILKPLEYTRIDRLVDIIFTTSEDLQADDVDNEITGEEVDGVRQQTKSARHHEAVVEKVSRHLSVPLIKQGRCIYTNADQTIRILCIVSKKYPKTKTNRFWYSFQPSQREFLSEGDKSFLALGCGSADHIILIPLAEFERHIPKMRTTESGGRHHWHVEIFEKNGKYLLNKATSEGIDVTRYLI
jgi:hypothetical protein